MIKTTAILPKHARRAKVTGETIETPVVRRGLRTWQLYLLVVTVHMIAAIVHQKIVLSREMYEALFAGRIDAVGIEELVGVANRVSLLGFIGLPLIVYVRVTIAVLVIQCGFLAMWIEIPFSRLFRVVAVASLTSACALVVKSASVAVSPPVEISAMALATVPLSIASFVDIGSYAPAIQALLQNLNGFEMIWMALTWWGICRSEQVKRSDAAFVVVIVWWIVVLFQAGVVLIISRGFA